MSQLTRRALARLAGASVSAASLAGSAPAGKRPNMIVVLADDQGYGDLSCHGHPEIRTPEIDRLHGEAVRFTDFHSSPMCTPTRAQLMTGCDALASRAMNVSSGRTLLRRDYPTLAEAFAASGYRTGIFGKWHLGDNYPYRPQDRGFHESVWYPSSHIGAVPDAWNNDYFNDRYRHNGHLEQYDGYSGDVFFGAAMRWIEARRGAGEPFFAYVPLNVAHSPLFVPPRFVDPYRRLPEQFARYYGMIANIDYNMGRLETMLRETGLRDNTILVYMTDNGGTKYTMGFNAGMRGNKIDLYEGGHRVPCFVRWPAGGVGGGRDVGELAHMQDIFPTAVELCGLKRLPTPRADGTSLAGLLQGRAKTLPERILVAQFSRMNAARPQKNDAAVMWKKWRLVSGKELYDIAADPAQRENVFDRHPEIVARLQKHYDGWWKGVEPALDSFLPVHVGSERENPASISACEWADVFLDQSAQVRRGVRANGVWHLQVEHAGEYEIALRRWPRECDAGIGEGVPVHKAEDGEYKAGVALPIARARLKIGSFDRAIDVAAGDREAVFRMRLPAGPAAMQSWFLDQAGEPLLGAYYAYVERKSAPAGARPRRIVFDTDMQGDVDDVGAVAVLHALANRGEAEILAMGVSAKHPSSPLCLDALNQHLGRPGIPIGVNKGPGFLGDSKYAEQIASGFPRRIKAAAEAPDAVALYRGILEKQPDRSVVIVSVGQLTNLSNLLKTQGGADLVRRKVGLWVCMGGAFPSGREANIFHDAASARHAVANWPTRIVFTGYEIGVEVLTGGKLAELPAGGAVRRAYELYTGLKPHKSWDQTAVLYGVRCLDDDRGLWTLSGPGVCEIDDQGRNRWRKDPNGRHQYLIARMAPRQVEGVIEELMLDGSRGRSA